MDSIERRHGRFLALSNCRRDLICQPEVILSRVEILIQKEKTAESGPFYWCPFPQKKGSAINDVGIDLHNETISVCVVNQARQIPGTLANVDRAQGFCLVDRVVL
jgi:hypothetical protein